MRAFSVITVAALLAVATVLALPGVALANGDDIHIGGTSIPLIFFIAFGGLVGLMVSFFIANWARYRRAQGRSGPSSGPDATEPIQREEDNDDGQ